MDTFMAKVQKCCEIIFSTFNLSVTICNESFQEVCLFKNAEMPLCMERYCPDYWHSAIENLHQNPPVQCAWHDLSACYMIFLDVRISTPDGSPLYISLGPALTKPYSPDFYQTFPDAGNLPSSEKPAVIKLLKSTPFFTAKLKNAFLLSYFMLQQVDELDAFLLDCPVLHPNPAVTNASGNADTEPAISVEEVNLNYENERKWRTLVALGDARGAKLAMCKMASTDFSYRMPEYPIRVQKHLLHSANVLCRAAAHDGGALPMDIHATHEHYFFQIERANTMTKIEQCTDEMLESYCSLVMAAKTQHLSAPVRKSVLYLHNYYDRPITLHSLAEAIHYSEGHLSRIFQKETGQTVSTYLNDLRIDHAKMLLETGFTSITDTALQVGFTSYSKFSVEFKKHTGLTASQYLHLHTK